MITDISFSIITPVYNREDCILRCLESVTRQNLINIEHLIVDDGSTDKTLELVKKYSKNHFDVTVFSFKKNKGVNAARNFAIKQCKKKYIIFLDSDDYMCENALETILKKINLYPGYMHYLFAQNDRHNYYISNPLLKCESTEIEFNDWIMEKISGDFLHVMSREMVQQFSFNEKLRIYEDLCFMQMYRYSRKQRFINLTLVNRERDRYDSVTKETALKNSNAIKFQYEYLKQMITIFEIDYRKYNVAKLNSMINRCLIFSLALSDYEFYRKESKRYKINNLIGYLICKLRLGWFLRFLIIIYSWIKHVI
nr:glycosyltransferase family 2 protein [uncultured Bacteroides sp.]